MNFINTKKYLDGKVDELKLPYFAVLVKKDGKVIFDYSFKREEKDNDLLCMYSMSKVITCVAFLQLVDKGLVKLDDNVSDYLPGFDDLKNFTTGEKYTTPIKMWNLLSMSSGLDYNFHRKAVQDLIKQNPNASTIDICSMFAKDGLLFEPGKGYQYSLSLDVIGAVIEKITKTKFSTYVEENVFKKLGMKNSTFKYNLELAQKCREEYYPNDTFTDISKNNKYYKMFYPTEEFESGGAGLISTVEDYSKFVDSIANRRNEILSDKLADEMGKVIIADTPFNETVKEFSKSSVEYGYGLAVRVRKIDSSEGIPAGEFGWDGATGSYNLIDRKNHISIVMGATIQNWPAYLKDMHIATAKNIYKDIFGNIK